METQYLKYFVEVAKTLNFSEASRNLNVSQPSLSAQVKLLEESLGVKVFERTKRKVALTRQGASLLPQAQGILQAIEEMKESSKKMLDFRQRKYRVAITPLIASSGVFETLVQTQQRLPKVKFSFFERSTSEILFGVKNHQFDFALMPFCQELEEPHFYSQKLIETKLVKVFPKGMGASKELPFISFHDGCGMRHIHDRFKKDFGYAIDHSLVAHHTDMVKCWIKLGLGWSLLPESALQEDRKHFTVKSVGQKAKISFGFVAPAVDESHKVYCTLFASL